MWGDEPDGEYDVPTVRVADFDRTTFRVKEVPTVRSVEPHVVAARGLRAGDLLLEKSGGGENQPVGAVVLYDHATVAVCSNFIARMPVGDGFDSRFLTYLHAALYALRINTKSIKQSTGIQNLDSDSYLRESAAFPDFNEQRAIAAFLDRETARIDALVAKKERLIELLQEKRSALITGGVTKGLNPKVTTKPSGNHWIGDIPSHWHTRRIAMAVDKITNGFVGPTRDILVNDGTRYLQSLHIKEGATDFERRPYYVTDDWSRQHSKSILEVGDVLVVQTGDIGQVCCVPVEFAGSNCHALIILRMKRDLGFGRFLSLLLQSTYGQNALMWSQTGALHPHLECGHVREIVVALPPPIEQFAICEYVERQSAEIDRLVATIRTVCDRLTELRSAVISAAVTGKIDVREEVP